MYLLSTSKETVLSKFDGLNVQSIYPHANGESTDFQCYNQQNIFVEVNKKSGLEIMRLKEKANNEIDIQRVRKLTIDNVYCVACSKQSVEEMAVGLSNGQIKLYNYKNSKFVYKFNADFSRQSVLYLDYNVLDSHIASVFENGQVGIYGLTTKTKGTTFNVDKHSTLAKFNPAKCFYLSIASQKGTVTVYDIHEKKRVFHANESHTAPCRDLCSSLSIPDTLISVGYDCCINIFDLRRNIQRTQITCCHPLSTVAVSTCGNYFCVGNLKGELISYDMRQLGNVLNSAKPHSSAVDRVTFIASDAERLSYNLSTTPSQNNSELSVNNSNMSISGGNRFAASNNFSKAEETSKHNMRDSFCDFIETQANCRDDKNGLRLSTRRDSFDWETFSQKTNENLKQLSSINITQQKFDNNSKRVHTQVNGNDVPRLSLYAAPRKLEQILEEEKQLNAEDKNKSITRRSDELPNVLKSDISSTETNVVESSSCIASTANDANITNLHKNASDSNASDSKLENNCEMISTNDSQRTQSMVELRQEMLKRMECLEFEMKFLIDSSKWEIINQSYNLWSQTLAYCQEMRENMALLLQADPFTNELARLKLENIALKQQLEQLKKN